MKTILYIVLIPIILLQMSCMHPPVEQRVRRSFGGYVYDVNTNAPIEGVEVKCYQGFPDDIVYTNASGYFRLETDVIVIDDEDGCSLSFSKLTYRTNSVYIQYDSLDAVCYLTPSQRYIVNGQVVDSSTDVGIPSKLRINFVPEVSDGYIGLSKSIDLTTDVNGNFELDFYYPEYYDSVNIDVTSDGYISKYTNDYTFSDEWENAIHISEYDFGMIKLNNE